MSLKHITIVHGRLDTTQCKTDGNGPLCNLLENGCHEANYSSFGGKQKGSEFEPGQFWKAAKAGGGLSDCLEASGTCG